MAKAELQYKTHTRQVQRTVVETEEVQKVSGITLTLTKREARTLRTICRAIAGPVKDSLRGVTDNINDALRAAGVGYFHYRDVFDGDRGVLCFTVASGGALKVLDEKLDYAAPQVDPEVPLKVGDKVRIVRKVKSHTGGWQNVWTERMDKFVNNGKVYTISAIRPTGVRFKEGEEEPFDGPWQGWPEAALEKVDLTLRKGARIKATTNGCYYNAGDTGTVLQLASDRVHRVKWDHLTDASYAAEFNYEVIG